MSISQALTDPLVARAYEALLAFVEPLTRHDRDSLALHTGAMRVVAGTATWHFAVTVRNERTEQTGRLPAGARALSSHHAVDEAAHQARTDVLAALPPLIHAWSLEHAASDREFTPHDCRAGVQCFAHERLCDDCRGERWIPCPERACASGQVPCPTCRGSRSVHCSDCRSLFGGNSGRGKCPACKGEGKVSGKSCGRCGASGSVDCASCHGRKQVPCTRCLNGTVSCGTCDGRGKVPCRRCDQTGYFTTLRTVDCVVDGAFHVQSRDVNAEVNREFASARAIAALRRIATVEALAPDVGEFWVQRRYGYRCPIAEFSIAVGDATIQFCAFGNEARFVDLHDVVPALLAQDKHDLEKAVEQSRLRLFGRSARIELASARFLASEANLRLDDAGLLQSRAFSEEYARESITLIRRALRRVVATRYGVALLLLAAASASATAAAVDERVVDATNSWSLLGVPIVAGVAAWLSERAARQHLIKAVMTLGGDESLGTRLRARLGYFGVFWPFRLVMGVIALASAAAGVWRLNG